jgi:hypothetical protein
MLKYYLFILPPLAMFFAFMPGYIGFKRVISPVAIAFLIFTFTAIILLLRDVNAATDMPQYVMMYKGFTTLESVLFGSWNGEITFFLTLYIGNLLSLSDEVFFLILPIIYLTIYAAGLNLIFDDCKHFLLALSFFSTTSTFVLLSTNVLRQGLGLCLLILFLGLTVRKQTFLAPVVLILSLFSHSSSLLLGLLTLIASRFLDKQGKISFLLKTMPLFTFLLPLVLLAVRLIPGGLFITDLFLSKFSTYEVYEYENHLIVYTRVIILYVSAIFFHGCGRKNLLFENVTYKYIFIVYLLSLSAVFLFLPVLVVCSRFIYYASGLMPLLFSFIFYSKVNFIRDPNLKYLIFMFFSVSYGYIVFNFPSVKSNLGI